MQNISNLRVVPRRPKRIYLWLLIIPVLLAAGLIAWLAPKEAVQVQEDSVLYVKDGAIYFRSFSQKESVRLVEDERENPAGILPAVFLTSTDGRKVLYPVSLTEEDAFTIMLYEAGSQPMPAADNVWYYMADDMLERMLYITRDRKLFVRDLTKEGKAAEEITHNVDTFYADDAVSAVLYINSKDELYLWRPSSGSRLMAENVKKVEYFSDDFSQLYFITKDYKLFYRKNMRRPKCVAENVIQAKVYDYDNLYYIAYEEYDVCLMDHINDDMVQQDALAVENGDLEYPSMPRKPKEEDFETQAEYEAAFEQYEKDYSEYKVECTRISHERQAKEEHDDLREAGELRETEVFYKYNLFYRRDGKETLLCDNVEGYIYADGNASWHSAWIGFSDYTPACEFTSFGPVEGKPINMSDITYYESGRSRYIAARRELGKGWIASGKYIETIPQLSMGKNGSRVEFFPDQPMGILIENNEACDNYELLFKKDSFEMNLYAENTFPIFEYYPYYYICNVDPETGECEFYKGENKIADGVVQEQIWNEECAAFITNWNSATEKGDLACIYGEDVVNIAGNVAEFYFAKDGSLIYLVDDETGTFTLYRWYNDEIIRLDDNAADVIMDDGSRFRKCGAYFHSNTIPSRGIEVY